MAELKYSVIKTKKQYNDYCSTLEELVLSQNAAMQDEIELLTLLIETWDAEQSSFKEMDPIELLNALMQENGLKAKDLVDILELSKGTVSKILNHQKGLSKGSIRKLAEHFKMAQEAFNRPYELMENKSAA
ncbi:MAG: helix-turn-helix domain-containing protein [Flavobacteriales bacterium]|jgi:HTH-type transcriptional regulator/antitoxin HigA|nr:helix-turn-helix domain-containing protein [Flavobacteriales bacterium]